MVSHCEGKFEFQCTNRNVQWRIFGLKGGSNFILIFPKLHTITLPKKTQGIFERFIHKSKFHSIHLQASPHDSFSHSSSTIPHILHLTQLNIFPPRRQILHSTTFKNRRFDGSRCRSRPWSRSTRSIPIYTTQFNPLPILSLLNDSLVTMALDASPEAEATGEYEKTEEDDQSGGYGEDGSDEDEGFG